MGNTGKINQRPEERENLGDTFWKNFTKGLFITKSSMDIPLVIITVLVACAGLVMLLSASYPKAYISQGNGYTFFIGQLGFMALGFGIMLFASTFNYNKLRIFSWVAWIGSLGLVTIAIAIGGGEGVNRRLGFFQPSEIVKFAVILLFAHALSRNHKKIVGNRPSKNKISGFISTITNGRYYLSESTIVTLKYGIILVISAGTVYFGSHLSGAIIILALGAFMFWIGEAKMRWFVAGVGVIAGVLASVYFFLDSLPIEEYMKNRIRAYLGDGGDNWQTKNGIAAIGSGGLFGLGIDGSRQKFSFVAEAHTDFIFTIIGEELGFIGCMFIILLYAALVGRGMYIAFRARNRFGTLLGMGITIHIAIQVLLNIAVVTGLAPNTGISLPLFSYGGTAVVMTLGEIGVLLNISRQADLPRVYKFSLKDRSNSHKNKNRRVSEDA